MEATNFQLVMLSVNRTAESHIVFEIKYLL